MLHSEKLWIFISYLLMVLRFLRLKIKSNYFWLWLKFDIVKNSLTLLRVEKSEIHSLNLKLSWITVQILSLIYPLSQTRLQKSAPFPNEKKRKKKL